MKTVHVRIKGIAPLLQHRMSLATMEGMDNVVKKRDGAVREAPVEDCLYRMEDGKIYQPAESILQAIIRRMGDYKIAGRGKRTYKEMAKGCLNVVPEAIVHKNQKWTVDVRSVVIPSTKGRTLRKRPRFDKWELEFDIEILNDQMPLSVLKDALEDAGREVGIGDYRPRFGRFMVTEFNS